MNLYRIVKSKQRASDLSGVGAFRVGGRWNSAGIYMLYTSENRSLALLETLVHFEAENIPPDLYVTSLTLPDIAPVYELPEKDYPKDWIQVDYLANKAIGDRLMQENKYLAVKVRSAINPYEYNFLLNPLFPRYHDLVEIADIRKLDIDRRLVERE